MSKIKTLNELGERRTPRTLAVAADEARFNGLSQRQLTSLAGGHVASGGLRNLRRRLRKAGATPEQIEILIAEYFPGAC